MFQNRTRPGPIPDKLHFACGKKHVPGWLNVDLRNSDWDVDLACGSLPWKDGTFTALAGEHIVEHLELHGELIPLLRELRRVARPGAELWISCPSMEKLCRSYFEHRGTDLIAEIRTLATAPLGLNGSPPQQIINHLFRQGGEHKNLFDEELLEWALTRTGFGHVKVVMEEDLLKRFQEFPRRGDNVHSIYVRAVAV
jgi:predicted SAM-dependent methyltransferase